jgi:hypothetical protein
LLYQLLAVMYLSAAIAGFVTGAGLSLFDLGTPAQMVILIEIVILLTAFLTSATRVLHEGRNVSLSLEAARLIGAHLSAENISKLFHRSVFVALFFAAFLFMKGLIPQIVPFRWDATLAEIDAALHLGRQPYEWLLPVFSTAWAAAVISLIYNLWLVALLVFLFLQILQWKNDSLRLQTLLAFGLTWFVGTDLLGVVFSSAGPCYYGAVASGAADLYQPLMAFLHAANDKIPILSLNVQAKLWDDYATHNLSAGDGISAMPSMHVASAVLLAWGAAAFAAAIFVGSITLGWHYAVDGYVGAALAVAFWYVSGLLVRSDIARQLVAQTASTAITAVPVIR